MKIRSMSTCLIFVTTMQFGCWTIASNAADEPDKDHQAKDMILVPSAPGTIQPPQLIQKMQELQGRAEFAAKALAGGRPKSNLAGNIRAAAEAVGNAKGDEAKAAAQKKLTDLLSTYFDEDTKRRQEELTKIEERLTKLRELLERRRSKKQEILELQMKVALNEAEGLGFYDNDQTGGPKFSNSLFRTKIDGSPYGGAWGGAESSSYSAPKPSPSAPPSAPAYGPGGSRTESSQIPR